MDWNALSELLLPDSQKTPAELEAQYPPRNLPEGAMVTRIAPSPTGFMHLGNLFGALTDERLAHRSGGVFYLRIEDTDAKREVAGGVETILSTFSRFGLAFDEGAGIDGERGDYGPYRQRQRAETYHVFAKELIRQGQAYPCFCTEEELEQMRSAQEAEKANFGYYGSYARCRNLTLEQIKEKLAAGQPYVLRFKSNGTGAEKIAHKDCIKGNLELTANDQDVVLLKSDGIPTYHFAHVVDDHLMRTTHVVRGEEWLATLPIHLELFQALGWQPPEYCHTAQLMKMENGGKRKLSKRKDPELALDFYLSEGYPVPSVKEYLLTLLNSNFEEWRIANPAAPVEEFPFSCEKMSVSGSLFDLDKLRDVSKNVIAAMSAEEVYSLLADWAREYDPDFYALLSADPDYARAILAIGRGGPKPRKDIALYSEFKPYMSLFYEELFARQDGFSEKVDPADAATILDRYTELYDPSLENDAWFAQVKELSAELGFSPDVKAYKKNPEAFKGHVGDVSGVLRVAVTGRTNSPDLCSVMKLLGKERVLRRISEARATL
ncbi:MAG: glutamate--tRNA ligase [Ruminococcaceae bacterium]|nr:glutamate--tRNA ligase [Oscillospiraceae bacterium]